MPANSVARSSPLSGWTWAGLLVVAVVVRAAVLWFYGASLAEDHDHYRRIAERLVAGDGFVDPAARSPTAYRPPLYPLLIAAIFFCGGGNMAIGVVHLALGIATVALTVLAARIELGNGSFAAGFLVAIDPLLLHQTSLVMTETLATFLAALLLWIALGPSRLPRHFALGLTFGLCCLCRPTFWAFGVLAVAGWFIKCVRARRTRHLHDHDASRLFRHRRGRAPCRRSVGAPQCVRHGPADRDDDAWRVHAASAAHNPAYTRAVVDQPWGAVWEGAAYDDWYEELEADMALCDASH